MPSPRIIVIQHVPYEPLGTLIPLMRERGLRKRYVNYARDPELRPTLDGYDGIIVLGGAMCLRESGDYPHLEYEVELLQTAVERKMPVLGICLGAQLLAKALGATVSKNPTKEIGWYDVQVSAAAAQDPVMRCFGPSEHIFQWHGDTFTLPERAVHLARTTSCENQAFRYGDTVYGFQFHLEVDRPIIKRWFHTPSLQRDLQAAQPPVDEAQVLRETDVHMPRSQELSTACFGAFLDMYSDGKTRSVLKSR